MGHRYYIVWSLLTLETFTLAEHDVAFTSIHQTRCRSRVSWQTRQLHIRKQRGHKRCKTVSTTQIDTRQPSTRTYVLSSRVFSADFSTTHGRNNTNLLISQASH